jgi:hypothetical protein
MMSGKIVVGIVAVLGLALLAYGLWFFGSKSPVDQRFNLKRQAIAAETPQAQLLPDRLGDFLRRSVTPISRTGDNQLAGSAAYSDADQKQIWLQVRSIDNPQSGAKALDAVKGDFKFHKDAQYPYGYGTTPAGYTFVWINGGWLIQAYTSEADAETLLEFVNSYPF